VILQELRKQLQTESAILVALLIKGREERAINSVQISKFSTHIPFDQVTFVML
jgi:hypothetical protein